ncbi:hypothetical protein vseg_015086 [Gypsophila vaccaria]
MGNCQAVDSTTLIVQRPNGNAEIMYKPIKAIEVMRSNPGHYVSLIIPLPMSGHEAAGSHRKTIRYNRVKLLRPTDTLVLGHAYRLVTSQEVKKVLRAKYLAKGKTDETSSIQDQKGSSAHERGLMTKSMISRSKTWRPSLQSISEAIN